MYTRASIATRRNTMSSYNGVSTTAQILALAIYGNGRTIAHWCRRSEPRLENSSYTLRARLVPEIKRRIVTRRTHVALCAE